MQVTNVHMAACPRAITARPMGSALWLAQQDLESILGWLRKRRGGQGVPSWSLPPDLWRVASRTANRTHSDTPVAKLLFDVVLLARAINSEPRLWACSRLCPIPKPNGKQGPAARRALHLLDPVGKAVAIGSWKRGRDYDNAHSFGFLPHKDRVQASINSCATFWHLRQDNIGFVAQFWDASNAFASTPHDALDARC